MEDGITRLNGADLVSVNTDGAPEGETVKVNADTLGGYPATDYVKHNDVVFGDGDLSIELDNSVEGDINPVNADTLGGISADEYATVKVLNEKFVVPNYSASTTLFSQTSVAGETPIYEHTMESDGYIYAYVNTNSSKAHPFMEFKIDNTLVYHYAKGSADTYTYRMSPLYPVKKGMQIYLRIGDYGVGGSGLKLFFIPVML